MIASRRRLLMCAAACQHDTMKAAMSRQSADSGAINFQRSPHGLEKL